MTHFPVEGLSQLLDSPFSGPVHAILDQIINASKIVCAAHLFFITFILGRGRSRRRRARRGLLRESWAFVVFDNSANRHRA